MASFKQKMHSAAVESLPTDLLLEIFPRLPCKDIVACKCVCRAWYDLLSHPNFSRHYAKNRPFTSVFLFKHRCATKYAFLLEIAADGRATKTPLTINIPNFYLDSRISATDIRHSYIIGSCNGLLFFTKSRRNFVKSSCQEFQKEFQRVYCYNPLSRECVLLAEREWLIGQWDVQYRIGYISSTGSMKLLAFVNNTQSAHILTVGIDCRWRRLDDCLDHHYKHRGVSFNGVYHWIHKNTHPTNPTNLKTFDFGKEKTGPEWELPHDLARLDMWMMKLTVLNNCISVIQRLPNFKLGMIIWTMKEYGVAESWCKKTVMGDYQIPNLIATLASGDLLFSSDNGGEFTFVNLEKEDTKLDIYKCTDHSSGILYVAESAPKFCSLDHSWNIPNM